MPRAKRVYLPQEQQFKINKEIERVCRRIPETDYAAYDAGHSDRSIAEKFGSPVTSEHVARQRRRVLGLDIKLPPKRSRIGEVEATLDALVQWAMAFHSRPFVKPGSRPPAPKLRAVDGP